MKNERAFPSETINDDHTEFNKGMLLRDYFAAKAMQSVITIDWYQKDPRSYEEMADCIAADAYTIADAMLLEREK